MQNRIHKEMLPGLPLEIWSSPYQNFTIVVARERGISKYEAVQGLRSS